ncbi:hypothetical protein K488DRAFT_14057, partial [Vararia minispora EC-137]
SSAFTWQFNNQPHQCQNLQLSASGGSPPYSLLLVPFGPTVLPNNIEARSLQQIQFNDSSSLEFQLRYPANETFIAVVSDSTGFGSGGTTTAVTVLNSDDTSCYNSQQSVSGSWVFSINPTGSLTTCQSVRFYWQQSLVQGNVTFRGVIPGGESFQIPIGSTSMDTNGTGFSWTPDIRPQTTIVVVAGDDRGPVGGSSPYVVNTGTDSSCLNSGSPSSTAGNPAGGSYPTSTTGAGTGGGSGGGGSGNGSGSGSSGTNVGAIAGGVVGGVGGLIAAIFLAWFLLFRKRRRTAAYNKERPVNILQDDEDDAGGRGGGELPQYYEPEPFLAPEPAAATDHESVLSDGQSAAGRRPGTPAGLTDITTSSRKTAMPRLRPVNIVQHEDAGPSAAPGEDEPETVELPPAYTHIRS